MFSQQNQLFAASASWEKPLNERSVQCYSVGGGWLSGGGGGGGGRDLLTPGLSLQQRDK